MNCILLKLCALKNAYASIVPLDLEGRANVFIIDDSMFELLRTAKKAAVPGTSFLF